MRDPNRIDPTIEVLVKAWKKNPDLRLGQLILNVCSNPTMLYYIEDDELVKGIKYVYLQAEEEAKGKEE